MGLGHSPSIISEGLVFYFDPINTRSYAGTGLTGYNLIDTSIVGSFTGGAVYDLANKGSVYFDGSNDYINIPDATALNPTTITISCWVKFTTFTNNANLVSKGFTSVSPPYIQYSLKMGDFEATRDLYGFQISNNGTNATVTSASRLLTNKYYFLTATYDGTTLKIYRDGVQDANTTASSGALASYATPLQIGRWGTQGSQYFNGNIASTFIYNRALSAAEILQNYNATKKRFSPEENIVKDNLVLYLDAGNNLSYAGTGNTAFSVSGIGYTATLTNGTAFAASTGGAFVLDGVDDYISAPIDTSLFSTEATMVIWLKNLNATPGSSGSAGLVGFGQGQVNDHYPWLDGLAYLSTFRNVRVEAITLSSTINRATPHMVTVTTNSTHWRLYQNTTLQYTGSSVGSVYLSRFTIGYSINSFFYQGNVYAFMIYNKALSSTEILQNYNALKGRYGLS